MNLKGAGFLPVARDREYGDKQFNIIFVRQDRLEEINLLLSGGPK